MIEIYSFYRKKSVIIQSKKTYQIECCPFINNSYKVGHFERFQSFIFS